MSFSPRRFPKRTATHERRFAYVKRAGNGRETLMLAELQSSAHSKYFPPRLFGQDVVELAQVIGSGSAAGMSAAQEVYSDLRISPDHRYLMAYEWEFGSGFHDHNISIFTLADGQQTIRFNEHSLPVLDRTTCESTEFNSHLSQLESVGVPQSERDLANFSTNPEGLIPQPRIAWSTRNTLMIEFELTVEIQSVSGFGRINTYEKFVFEFDPSGNSGDAPLGCNHRAMPRQPWRSDTISVQPSPFGRVVHFDAFRKKRGIRFSFLNRGRPLPFQHKKHRKVSRIRVPRALYRNAVLAAGRPRL